MFKFFTTAFLFIFSLNVQAQYPSQKPVEVVVGYTAGGSTDVMARKLFSFVQKRLGNDLKMIVVNKTGASGEIANSYVAKATSDGATIGIINLPSFIFTPMLKKALYEKSDFRLIARVVDDPTMLIVKADSPFKSFEDVAKLLRANPQSVTFGHNGIGTNGHIATKMIAEVTGLQANEIGYRGSAAQKVDLLSGSLQVGVMSISEVPELYGDAKGDLRVLSQLSEKRLETVKSVPTLTELGYKVVMSSERGVAVQKDMPENLALMLEKAIEDTLKDPEYLKSAAADVPVLAFMKGAEWKVSMEKNEAVLKPFVGKMGH